MSGGKRGHREVEHTADVAFEAWAEELDDLFAEATLALCELCYDPEEVEGEEERDLEVEGDDREQLMVRWLQEIYLLEEMEGWLTAGVKELRVGDGEVVGELVGEPIDRERHTLHTEIKAITYHGLEVECREDGLWRATVIVDV